MLKCLSLIAVGLFFFGCASDEKPLTKIGLEIADTTANVYDDCHSTAYLKVTDSIGANNDAAICDIMKKKSTWEKKYPQKMIIAMSVITRHLNEYRSKIEGLLIHYEYRSSILAEQK